MSEYAGEYSRNAIKRARLVRSMRELLLLRSKLPNRVVIQAPRSEFALFCRWAIRGATRGVGQTIVVDEVNLYCRAGSAPVELLELMRIGRHASVDFLFSARRPSEISRDLTAQADVLRIFRTLEPIDLDWFKKRCGKRFADTLTVLPKYHSAVFSGVLEDAQATHIDPPI